MQNGVALVYSGERGIKSGLCLIKIRSGQALCGVKRLRALVVLLCLDVLGRSLTYLGFCLINLILQVLLTNLRKNSSADNVVSRIDIPPTSVRADDLLNACYIA